MKNIKNRLIDPIKNKDVKFLAKYLFDFDITPKQEEIIRIIAFREHNRVTISAMTRYGKSQCVAIGILLYLLFTKGKRIALIAPQKEQATILRDYIAELIIRCPILINLLDIDIQGAQKLKKEVSKNRMTFKNNSEVRIFSAAGEANRLMGFGADFVIKDEACLIGRDAHAKIMRMLGDDPKHSVLVELYNPWDRDNNAYEHTLDNNFHHIEIGYKDAIAEGRTTEKFVEEQRRELTPLEFTVLYESKFPEQSEDALLNFKDITSAVDIELPEWIKDAEITKIIGVDVARLGLDKTVFVIGNKYKTESGDLFYEMLDIKEFFKQDTMISIGKLMQLVKELKINEIHIDNIGLGSTFFDRVQEVVRDQDIDTNVVGCHFGESASKSHRFSNKKAENYFHLKDMFVEKRIKLINNKSLLSQLAIMKWELNSSGKIKIVDPETKSPDFADACCYFLWKPIGNIIILQDPDGIVF